MDTPWLTSLTFRSLDFPFKIRASGDSEGISFNKRWAFAQEMGKLGIFGMFSPSVRVAFSYAGYPGVVGSPKYHVLEDASIIYFATYLDRRK